MCLLPPAPLHVKYPVNVREPSVQPSAFILHGVVLGVLIEMMHDYTFHTITPLWAIYSIHPEGRVYPQRRTPHLSAWILRLCKIECMKVYFELSLSHDLESQTFDFWLTIVLIFFIIPHFFFSYSICDISTYAPSALSECEVSGPSDLCWNSKGCEKKTGRLVLKCNHTSFTRVSVPVCSKETHAKF